MGLCKLLHHLGALCRFHQLDIRHDVNRVSKQYKETQLDSTTTCTVQKEEVVILNLATSVSYLFCIIKYSGDPLPALYSNSDYIFQNISKCHGRMLS